jgi:uncharacterized repeat protein (TIGR03803 family)
MMASLSRFVARAFLCFALAGCSSGTTVSPQIPSRAGATIGTSDARAAPAAVRSDVTGPVDTILYDFLGSTGAYSYANLVGVNGTFYGTTANGGANDFAGTVFSVTPSGSEVVLHSFGSGSDGSDPLAGLVEVGALLYGTTSTGGAKNLGTVFSISTSGVEKVLYSFKGGADGSQPQAGLLDVGGKLYGTTTAGGADGLGTVFSITKAGTESVLYSFKGGADGSTPEAALINIGKKLYGTTAYGGGGACNKGCGTVFSLTTAGTETVLHSFQGAYADGQLPESALVDLNGTLYGTTYSGGNTILGTVFSVSLSGTESVLYNFSGENKDGAYPNGLIAVNGVFYGTTESGGPASAGTVFSITPSGTLDVLYTFKGGTADGKFPRAALLDVDGTLYGTTQTGGTDQYGTIFSVVP